MSLLKALDSAQQTGQIRGGMAEIGVHHGKLFISMHLLRHHGEASIAIDLFELQDLNRDGSGEGNRRRLLQNLRIHAGGLHEAVVLAGDSATLSGAEVKDRLSDGVRIFSVDGGHTAELVCRDMQTAAEAVVPGGIVVADDVFNEGWPSVIEGTLQFLDASGSLLPFAIGFNKTFFTTDASSARSYRRAVESLARRRRWSVKDSTMHGSPVTVVWKMPLPRRVKLAVQKRTLTRFR